MSKLALKLQVSSVDLGRETGWTLEKNRQKKELAERLLAKNKKRRSAPATRTKPDSTMIHIKVPKFTRNQLRKLAKKKGLSVNTLVNELLEHELEKEDAFDQCEILMMGIAGKGWFEDLNFDSVGGQ